MNRDNFSSVSGEDYISAMFTNTAADGKLLLEDEEYSDVFHMDWTEADVAALTERFEKLLATLTQLGKFFPRAEAAEDLPEELQEVWNTYLRPYPPHGMDDEELMDISMKEDMGDVLTDEEQEMLDKERQWLRENALRRLPFNRCHPVKLIQRARRYERLLELRAPQVVVANEERALAEAMALYYHSVPMHRCRCCGTEYSLLDFGGYDIGSICPACDWEEDWLDETGYSCANRSTLQEYRKKHQVVQS